MAVRLQRTNRAPFLKYCLPDDLRFLQVGHAVPKRFCVSIREAFMAHFVEILLQPLCHSFSSLAHDANAHGAFCLSRRYKVT